MLTELSRSDGNERLQRPTWRAKRNTPGPPRRTFPWAASKAGTGMHDGRENDHENDRARGWLAPQLGAKRSLTPERAPTGPASVMPTPGRTFAAEAVLSCSRIDSLETRIKCTRDFVPQPHATGKRKFPGRDRIYRILERPCTSSFQSLRSEGPAPRSPRNSMRDAAGPFAEFSGPGERELPQAPTSPTIAADSSPRARSRATSESARSATIPINRPPEVWGSKRSDSRASGAASQSLRTSRRRPAFWE